MYDTKAWYRSKTVWGSIITLFSMAAALAGAPIETADQQMLTTLATTAAGALGGILSLVGRVSATDRITR
ncbi:hypothetical protein [Pseudohoeflea coraliihabitans]|uniref:Holin n=1 Tax=Pseudohoeflea coraliihabitans TaxID=2860393 RepID=A0ABS6WRS4_9HYPH|nr:hypothetical protein [Pseudohoeflea sp. DP4N28-3]MBW3098672.1 hypothetical protein [Pseudohoeflea sp. DP4N28-3]